jgi:hypothetical protein
MLVNSADRFYNSLTNKLRFVLGKYGAHLRFSDDCEMSAFLEELTKAGQFLVLPPLALFLRNSC